MSETSPLQVLGDVNADSCEGDVCVIPPHPEHAIMSRRLDEDLV
jgi:hypothetical protein